MYESRLGIKVTFHSIIQCFCYISVCLIADNLYKTFLQLLFDKLPKPSQSTVDVHKVETDSNEHKPAAYSKEQIAKFREEFAQNQFLFLFENQLSQMEKSGEPCHCIEADDNLYDRLKPTTTFILPYHQYFCTILTNLLNARIAVANDCVLEIYKNEHQLVHHLENLPKIFFMEAGDLMSDFYSKLFTQVSKSTCRRFL